jgi:hypothetical protein
MSEQIRRRKLTFKTQTFRDQDENDLATLEYSIFVRSRLDSEVCLDSHFFANNSDTHTITRYAMSLRPIADTAFCYHQSSTFLSRWQVLCFGGPVDG